MSVTYNEHEVSEMGYITTVIVRNDTLNAIKDDPQFGRKLAEAILQCYPNTKVDVCAEGDRIVAVNAATVICSLHASEVADIRVEGGTAHLVVPEPSASRRRR